MLNRNDLAKQFELVVKQEVKNHNDSILATNMALEEIRRDMRAMEHRHEREMMQIKEQVFSAKLRLDSLVEKCTSLDAKVASYTNDSTILAERNHKLYSDLSNELHQVVSQLRKHDQYYTWQQSTNRAMDKLIADSDKSLRAELGSEARRIRNECASMIRCLEDKPSEASKMRCQIDADLHANKIDVKGVHETIDKFRKEFDYERKKIENIYMLIERIQKKFSNTDVKG